jgi:uncharacterized protein YfkK (UPF0435 family)
MAGFCFENRPIAKIDIYDLTSKLKLCNVSWMARQDLSAASWSMFSSSHKVVCSKRNCDSDLSIITKKVNSLRDH